jgi:hypothetical protein
MWGRSGGATNNRLHQRSGTRTLDNSSATHLSRGSLVSAHEITCALHHSCDKKMLTRYENAEHAMYMWSTLGARCVHT